MHQPDVAGNGCLLYTLVRAEKKPEPLGMHSQPRGWEREKSGEIIRNQAFLFSSTFMS